MSNLKVYEVSDGGEAVWAITDDPEKARAISREYLRDTSYEEGSPEYLEEYPDAEEITELPMDHVLGVTDDDTGDRLDLTCAAWIEREGEGFLATTCY